MYDLLLRDLSSRKKPIDVIVCGLGFMGLGFVSGSSSIPGIRVPVVISRRPQETVELLMSHNIAATIENNISLVKNNIQKGVISVTDDLSLIKKYKCEVVIEMTGTVDYGTEVALKVIEAGKHLVTMNPELQATVGTKLKELADRKNLVVTDVLGDQPGSLTRMIAQAKLMGFEVVVAGNMKRFLNESATQKEMQPWADSKGLNVKQTTSFTDGTKQSIEMNLVANHFGMTVKERGMVGLKVENLNELLVSYDFSKLPKSGVVDYALGLNLFPGIFIIAKHKDPNQVKYLKYLSLGDGPYYLLFEPYHLCHLEVAQTIAKVVLYRLPTINNSSTPTTITTTVAKRDIKKGEKIDGIGGDMVYGVIDSLKTTKKALPVGLAGGATALLDIKKGMPIRLKDVVLPTSPATVLLGMVKSPSPQKKSFLHFPIHFPSFSPAVR